MPDEITPGAAGQGGNEAPGSGQGFDFERAYGELQPEFTRRSQRLSEYEGLFAALHDPDPEVQQAAADYIGLELVPEETGAPAPPASGTSEEEWEDPLEKEVQELRATVAELRQRSELEDTRQQAAETEELRDDYIDQNLELIEQQMGRKLKPQEDEVIGNLAIAMEDEDGVPDVMGAYQRLYGDDGVLEAVREQWIETKTSAGQAPSITALKAEKKLDTPAQRIDYIDRRARDMADQQ